DRGGYVLESLERICTDRHQDVRGAGRGTSRELGVVGLRGRREELNGDRFSVDVAEVHQSTKKPSYPFRRGYGIGVVQKRNPWHFRRQLRSHDTRQCCGRASERQEIAPSHE